MNAINSGPTIMLNQVFHEDITHFKMRGYREAHVFGIEPCDHCGGDMQKPNAFTIFASKDKLISHGGIEHKGAPLPEGGYMEHNDEVWCDECYTTHPTEE